MPLDDADTLVFMHCVSQALPIPDDDIALHVLNFVAQHFVITLKDKVVERLEPDIYDTSVLDGTLNVSLAISMKRLADLFEAHEKRVIEFYSKADVKF